MASNLCLPAVGDDLFEASADLAGAFESVRGNHWQTVPGSIVAIRNDLLAQCVRTEPDFVAVASNLRGLYGNAGDLAKLVATQVGEIRALVDGNHLTGLVEHASNELLAALTETDQSIHSLRRVAGELTRIRALVREVEQIASVLRASVYYFSIETARTPGCKEAFGGFAEEMRVIGVKVLALVERIGTDATQTQAEQSRVLDGLAKNLEQLRTVAAEAETTVCTTSREVQNLLGTLFASLKDVEVHSREVARHANEAVYQLQFGDIVRQKSEHIIAALDEIEPELHDASTEDELERKATEVAQTLALQSGQMQLIHAEIGKAQSQLSGCFAGIGDRTRQLADLIGLLDRSSGQASGTISPFVRLRTDLTQLRALQEEGRGLLRHARETGKAASQAVTCLSGYLHELHSVNHKMHLLALNAIIIAHSLGEEGTVLRTLAAEVETLFRESSLGVTEIMTALEAMSAFSNEMPTGQADGSGEPSGDRLQLGLSAVETVHRNLALTSRAASTLVRQQDDTLAQSRGRLSFLEDLGQGTSALRGQLVALQNALRPWKSERFSTTQTGVARYTMASERLVQKSLDRPSAPGAGNPAAAGGDTEMFGDMDIFEAAPPADLPSTAEAPADENIDFF